MKLRTIVFATVFLYASLSHLNCNSQPMTNEGFTVVELFTSEGCSSCPAAESALSDYVTSKNAYILEYHVDYWDRLGWKDPFSSADYSHRQSKYAEKMNLSSVYTPQVVVNGINEFVGSDRGKLKAAFTHPKKATIEINITASVIEQKLEVTYSTSPNNNKSLCIALVQNKSTMNVTRGENSGRVLHHYNIVRNLKVLEQPNKSGKITFDLSVFGDKNDFSLVAFLQDTTTNEIVAVKKLQL